MVVCPGAITPPDELALTGPVAPDCVDPGAGGSSGSGFGACQCPEDIIQPIGVTIGVPPGATINAECELDANGCPRTVWDFNFKFPPYTGVTGSRSEWRYKCIDGILRAYRTSLTYNNGRLTSSGPEFYDHDEGCCACPASGTGTGTGVGGCTPGVCDNCADPPIGWVVPAEGFFGACDVFNRTWLLSQTGDCAWGDEGTSAGLPIVVSLVAGASEFVLTFEYGNAPDYVAFVSYTIPRADNDCCSVLDFATLTACECGDTTSPNPGDECSACAVTPASWDFTLAEFTGSLSPLNGAYHLDLQAGCSWTGSAVSPSLVVTISVSPGVIGLTLQLTVEDPINGNSVAVYNLPDSLNGNCCSPATLELVLKSTPPGLPGKAPPTVDVVPSCTGSQQHTCPANVSAMPSCCGGGVVSGVGSGSGAGTGSGGGTVSMPCCDNLLPAVLHATFGGGLAGSGTVAITWDPFSGSWSNFVLPPPMTDVILSCSGSCGDGINNWTLGVTYNGNAYNGDQMCFSGGGGSTTASVICNPFLYSSDVFFGGVVVGSVNITT